MSSRPEQFAKPGRTLSAKAAYSKAAHKKLAETRLKLAGVNAKIGNAIATGRIDSSAQLSQAQRGVDQDLATAEALVDKLRKSGEDAWERARDDVDNAWEDLSQSVKKLVAIFTDGSNS
ncbi:MAG: hypothetical protein OEM60_06935 [Gammaproteobacteria bacterium]|nr:hypothetical protein [Gammaproteobacteria bacterium]MDH3430611.1 hypothetical protein [Gammaproteobacteria bacterium]MDH3433574.1 hypothetical protein [Gammaproteobacteria bacterium]